MILEKEYLRDLAARASYLTERRDAVRYRREPSPQSEERLEYWKEKVGRENFPRVMELERLTPGEALELCGYVSWLPDSLPPWEEVLVEIASFLPMKGEVLKRACYRKPDESPFVLYIQNCFLIYVYYAMDKLKGMEALFTDKALESIYQSLVDRLTSTGIAVMQKYSIHVLSGKAAETASLTPGERAAVQPYEVLISGAYKEIWKEFPVLARQLCEITASWIAWIQEAAQRIKKDFGARYRICGVRANISDSHGGGRSALILEFTHGRKLVYKPHPLDMDGAWKDFCREANLLPGIHLSYAPADSRDGYGYVEFIPYESLSDKKEASLFFEHAGMLLCAMYILGSCDMHYENLIERRQELYVIDAETLLQPGREKSLKKTGMLRLYLRYGGETLDDYGGITNKTASTGNLPVIRGELQSAAEHPQSLCKGFQTFYNRILQSEPGKLKAAFRSCSPRTVLRNTNTYALLLNELNTTGLLRDGFLYSCEVEKLSKACVSRNYAIFQSERRALLQRDIPVFYHRQGTCDLYDHRSLIAPGFFEGTPYECLSFDFLSEKDRDFQSDEICSILNQKECEITDMDALFFKRLMADGRNADGLSF